MKTHIRSYLLQAYLNRELDSDTEAEFELELLSDPELADLAAADTALLLGLSDASASVESRPILPVTTLPPLGKPVRRTKAPWLRFAAAASILMLLAGALGYTVKPRTQILGGAQLAYIDKQRSVGNSIQIKLPQAGPVVLMVPVASATACVAEISITQATHSVSAKSAPDSFGYAVVVLANEALKPGSAAVSVSCQGSRVGLYEVQVVPAQ